MKKKIRIFVVVEFFCRKEKVGSNPTEKVGSNPSEKVGSNPTALRWKLKQLVEPVPR